MTPPPRQNLSVATRPPNRLLRSLPGDDFRRLVPDLKTIPVKVKQVLHRQGDPVEYVYFPNDGVASVTTVLSNGTMVEAATCGDEGMIGVEAFFADHPLATGETMLQVPGSSMEMLPIAAFRREIARQGTLARSVGCYAQVMIAQIMQTAACNALHPIQERCCRWLLQTHDRFPGNSFQLSHEFLAIMLGVRRATVTVVAGTLQAAGLIRYSHGHVEVLHRAGLEEASCECYQLIRDKFESLYC